MKELRYVALLAVLSSSLVVVSPASADEAAPITARTYQSENGEFRLTVEPEPPRAIYQMITGARLRFESKTAGLLWERAAKDFKDFLFPLTVLISNDGRYIVFGGYAVHNDLFEFGSREGIRIYRADDGMLVRFVSRKKLPRGPRSVSTEHWYDYKRSRIDGETLLLFTPNISAPIVFELASGKVLKGNLVQDTER